MSVRNQLRVFMEKYKSLLLCLQFSLLLNGAFVHAAGVSASESDLELSTIGNVSGYTLTKITDESSISKEDFVITKYLGDSSIGNLTPIKYLITFEYPLGDDRFVGNPVARYFKWSVDENSNKSLINTGPYDTAKDITAYSSNNLRLDTTTDWVDGSDVTHSFLNRGTASVVLQGGGLYNAENRSVGDIMGSFIANFAEASESTGDGVYGGAIYSGNYTAMRLIGGNFIGNYVKTSGREAQGGAIYLGEHSSINKINGNFISNYAYSSEYKDRNYGYGGGIYLSNYSKVDRVVGDFIDNWSSNCGGAIYCGYDVNIKFLNGDFIGNHSGSRDGGAIAGGSYGVLMGDFVGNYSDTEGGAIARARIDELYGNFIENYGVSAYGSAGWTNRGGGGAISDVSGTIYGDFIGNYAVNGMGGAVFIFDNELNIYGNLIENHVGKENSEVDIRYMYGGAVYVWGGVSNITGDLLRNYIAINDDFNLYRRLGNTAASGGAIDVASEYGCELTVNGNFIGNNISGIRSDSTSLGFIGGALSNKGSNTNITLNSNFSNNYLAIVASGSASTSSARGGAICNAGNVILNNSSFTSNFIDVQNVNLNANITAKGGAIYVTTSTTAFNVSEGAKVKSYGNYAEINGVKEDANGGFLYMADSALVNFNTEKGSSYIIGEGRVGYDSIASDDTNNIINKNGKGEVVVNSSMEFYKGTLNVNEGNMTVNNKLGASRVMIANGASLSAKVNSNGSVFTNAALNYSNDGILNLIAGETLASGNYDVFVFENPETVYFGNVKNYGGTFDHATGTFIVENALNLTIGERNPVNVQSNGRILAVGPEAEDTFIVMNFNSAAGVTVNSVFATTESDIGFAEIVNSINAKNLLLAESFAFDVENLGIEDTVNLSFFVGEGYDISQFTVYHKDAELGWELANISNLEYDGEYLSFIVDGFSSYGYVAAVPEASTYATIMGAISLCLIFSRKRK